jgi:DNA polymerase, archaea type
LVKGWLFDSYPLQDKMVFWIKQENGGGDTIRLDDDSWSHSIYVAADDKSDLKSILKEEGENIAWLIKDYEFTPKYERITDSTKSEVLKLTLSDSTKALTLARKIETLGGKKKFGKFRLYNVDLLPAQSYFYEYDLFPLAFCKVNSSSSSSYSSKLTNWNSNEDNVWSIDYRVPNFKTIYLTINIKKEQKILRYTDRITSITINQENETFEINKESEADMIDELTDEVTKIDPDFIFTNDGDSFAFPYLIYRAEENDIDLILSREPIPLKKPTKEGISYFSYGRIYFKPTTVKLFGRIHVDISNSFFFSNEAGEIERGLDGLYEISRICRMPLHTASRASIGKCLSSLQFYHAMQKEILIPWKPTLVEHLKTFEKFFIADRGGFIFEPKIGVHEQVAEFDFISLYPNIMLKKNLSAETIHCNCCQHSKLRVPELDYNICEKRKGIVPTSLKILLEKRAAYKRLLKLSTNRKLKAIYEARQFSLKWVLVTSFGYLGFNNAKFGRIDAHIAVCAFDRQILLQTAKIAERHGFKVIHGIIDSLWIQKKNNNNNNTKIKQGKKNNIYDDYQRLKKSIEQETGFIISFEGIYKWIVFVCSKRDKQSPVGNRYFGAFENGSMKIRGIETRRYDTPTFLSKFQCKILEIMARGNSISEVKALMPEVSDAFIKYSQLLKENKVPLEELVFTKQTSKNSNEYKYRNTVENNAIQQLRIEDKSLKAGQILKYIITDYYGKHSTTKNRTVPIELINEKTTTYDIRRYTELLAENCNSVTEPFDYTITAKDTIQKYI